jgi:hypothetical protein
MVLSVDFVFFLKRAKVLPYSLIKKEFKSITTRGKLGTQNELLSGHD